MPRRIGAYDGPPEQKEDVRGHDEGDAGGEDCHVKAIRMAERRARHLVAASEEAAKPRADQWDLPRELTPDPRMSVRGLGPREDRASECESEPEAEREEAAQPAQLLWRSEASADDDREEVRKEARDEEIARPHVHRVDEISVRDLPDDLLYRLVRVGRIRAVVEHQKDAAGHLHAKEEQRDAAEVEDEASTRRAMAGERRDDPAPAQPVAQPALKALGWAAHQVALTITDPSLTVTTSSSSGRGGGPSRFWPSIE